MPEVGICPMMCGAFGHFRPVKYTVVMVEWSIGRTNSRYFGVVAVNQRDDCMPMPSWVVLHHPVYGRTPWVVPWAAGHSYMKLDINRTRPPSETIDGPSANQGPVPRIHRP